MKPVRFLRVSYFIWILILLGLWLFTVTAGLPHFRWSYDWRDDGQGYDPHAERHYTRCTYLGPYGQFTLHPMNGHCAFIRFQKKAGSQD